jgi:predicted AlkP superfamily phosphohydrolase/phosphomutase
MGRKSTFLGVIVVGCALLYPTSAWAYIGPGAGFAFAGSLLLLLATFLLAIGTVLLWPITALYRLIRVGNPYARARTRRVVVLGFDGLDPGIATRLMQEGRLPHLRQLAEQGVFRPLDTSTPSMSPVAWSTFSTGVDASRHRIFDFLTRDPCTYMPMLSSSEIQGAKKVMGIGRYLIPLEKPRIRLLQRSEWFWKHLGDKNIASVIQRVPITFPPKPFKGLLLSGMCVPDLRGSQGTFSFFSTRQREGESIFNGGEQTVLRRKGNRIRSRLVGPENSMLRSGGRMTLPFTLTINDDRTGARLEIDGADPVELELRNYSDWIRLEFRAMPMVKVHGLARFYLTELDPEVSLYVTPIQIDPENPAMPISYPPVYSVYLAKKQGPFGTLGLVEDTWALNERVIDEQAFWDQTMLLYREREKMFFDALEHTPSGLVTTVFDTTDRVQHMFYRYLDPTHPANAGKDTEEHKDKLYRVYEIADELVGKTLEAIEGTDTVLAVISDHGFANFRRGVDLNAWLRDEGYLVLRRGTTSSDWCENVDWSQTRAFSLGLAGIFINRKGRERDGIVAEGEEYRALVREMAAKLENLTDPETGEHAVRKARIAADIFDGPYRFDAPDIVVGFAGGYRSSWECAKGATTEEVFCDNTKSWSGDHCLDPDVVPGVLFANQPINTETPRLVDMPYSIMRLFGQDPPKYMQGAMLFCEPGEPEVRGPVSPDRIEQSGAAPGALVHRDDRSETREASA